MDEQDPIHRIAAVLGETQPDPLAQLSRLVERCGLAQAEAWLARTQEIEARGGMLIQTRKRRRTPGGVFFYVARNEIKDPEVRTYIFGSANEVGQPPTRPVERWQDRGTWITAAEAGRATTVKMTVIGKPGKPVERPGFTLVRLNHTPKLDSLPKGLPTPATAPETSYLLYIGAKQWRKVADAIRNPEDLLIAEGMPCWDAQQRAITVFVTNCTTKLLQQAQKAAQKAKSEASRDAEGVAPGAAQ